MSVPLTVGSNTSIGLYLYEPFSYTWTYPGASNFSTVASTGVAPFVKTTTSNVVFSNSAGMNTTSSRESITIQAFQDLSASILLATSSNSVVISNARFVTDASANIAGTRFTFYKNEPITPVTFSSAFELPSAPIPTPTLPAGLSFVSNSPTKYLLTGTPLVQIPSCNYNIIGSNPPKYIPSCPITIAVNGERMVLDLSGTGIASLMEVGTSITTQALFAKCPPYPRSGGNLSNIRYTWTQLPLGLEFADSGGVARTSPFIPSDASATLVLRGTPTVAGAMQFADLGLSQASVAVTATRYNQSPIISNSQSFTFSFGETVLFDTISLSPFFSNVTLDPSANYIRAQTYFTSSNVPISNIISTDLQIDDLSLAFVPSEGRAYFTGTPTSTGSALYTFRAINSNGVTRDVSAVVSVVSDSITITSPVDTCYNFVRARPVSNALTGYYPYPISWSATAASGNVVTFSAAALAGTGIELSVSGSTATLIGTPANALSLRNLRIDVSASGSPATAYSDVSFAILNDQLTFTTDPSTAPVLVQNKAMVPLRFSATALSGRNVATYSSSNLPSGLSITNYGVLQGTPLVDGNGTATIVGSTGASVGSNSFPYSILSDRILFFASPNPAVYATNLDRASIQITGLAYTGSNASNYALSGLPVGGNLVIDSATGLITGFVTDTIADGVYPFSVTAQTGTRTDTLPASMVVEQPKVTISFSSTTVGGPTVVSPVKRDYTFYQYVPIAPITFSATATGDVRYYLRTSELPAGLSFDPITGILSGKTVERGRYGLTVYASDSNSTYTPIPISFTTISPVIVRDGVTPASAYTSLIRQYTTVNAARNAENNEVYPSESRAIGTFAAPYPPDEITQTVDPKCYSTSNCP